MDWEFGDCPWLLEVGRSTALAYGKEREHVCLGQDPEKGRGN